jgi:hypothetical protein
MLQVTPPHSPDGSRRSSRALPPQGTVLMIVDQPASIGDLPLTVARDAGRKVAYLPGLAMRRIADRHPGEAKVVGPLISVSNGASRARWHHPPRSSVHHPFDGGTVMPGPEARGPLAGPRKT